MTARQAYHKALAEGPSNITRQAVLSDGWFAYLYANYVDKCPREDTRNATLYSCEYSYLYGLGVDKKPRKDTRDAVLSSYDHACLYAEYVDKVIYWNDSEDIYIITLKHCYLWKKYVKSRNLSIKFNFINLLNINIL